MTQTLSSRNTFFLKWVVTPLWICLFGIGTVGMWIYALFPAGHQVLWNDWLLWLSPFLWLFGSWYMNWGYGQLKKVRMDENNLYISNYLMEIEVPLAEVVEVEAMPLMVNRFVHLKFKNETRFGNKVVFLAKAQFLMTWSMSPLYVPHSVVAEIKAAVEKAKNRHG